MRPFAAAVFRGWAEALGRAGTRRIVWLDDGAVSTLEESRDGTSAEAARVDAASPDLEAAAAAAARLDDLPGWQITA